MNTRKLEVWILLADLTWIALAFFAADLLRFGLTWKAYERTSIQALLPFVIATYFIWIALSLFMPMDGFRGGWKLSAVFSHLLFGTGCTLSLLLALGYLTRSYVSRLAFGYFIVLLVLGFVAVRCSARLLLRWRHNGGDIYRVVILGSGRVAQEVAAKIEQHPEMLCRVVGLLYPDQDAEQLLVPGLAREGAVQLSTLDIFNLLQKSRVDEVIIALSQPLTPEIRTLIARIRDMGIEITLVPQSYELYAARPKLIALDGLPLVQLREPGLGRRYVVLKRVLDVVLASLLIVPSIFFIVPFALIFLVKKGSAFRWETRSGQFGVPFQMLRLNVDRSQRSNSRLELLLEHLSITELPQLWNVFRGQMSLVGPRPDPPARLSQYSPWQQRRLRVRPGMTGLAQVHGLRESNSPEEKTRFDLQYLLNPYLLWDISLLLQTVWTLLRRVLSFAPVRRQASFDLGWKTELPQDMISHAHRTQSSAD
ncbi:MAG: sugar transferase [Acidobacteria bacterium]|nr:sugar transferase [Acidobacteriota bacterium]MBV9625381.1 sugar transferase [Acidobacteriota bacterium]